MTNDINANARLREQARKQALDLNGFDYQASAELFPGRTMKGGGGHFKYRRFDTAAEALRFAVEQMPASALPGACLEIDEMRFGSREIRYLYDNVAYPRR
jgi:hypothetical protein